MIAPILPNTSRSRFFPCSTRVMWAGAMLLVCATGLGADKNGVSPNTISLPSGPGSIQGLGESFQPQLNEGSGSYAVPLVLPSGPGNFAPSLRLEYNTGNPNSSLGLGWKLAGPTMIMRNMDRGLPLYVEAANGLDDDFDGAIDNPEEIDGYDGIELEELVKLADASYRSETEGSFLRYTQSGDGWNARSKNGILHQFGLLSGARIEQGFRKFAWLLEKSTDRNGNVIEFSYMSHPNSPGQKYVREIRWARSVTAGDARSLGLETKQNSAGASFYAAVFTYDSNRSDQYSDYRSGFEVRTGLRLSRIDVIMQGVPSSAGGLTGDLNGDTEPDTLIRRYILEYQSGALQSLLSRITQLGSDGATALPTLSFEYTQWIPPDNVSSSIIRSSGDPIAALDSNNVELIDMNRDGLPDLLQATSVSHRVHLNLGMNATGRLAWDTVGATVTNAPSLNLGSTSVHLADHSADGEADLIHKVNDTTIQCFINSGQRSWLSPVNLGNTDSWPRWPFENAGSRTLDTDHNRMHDILFTSDSSYRLWMLMPGGRYGREVPLPVLSDGTQPFKFDDPGARIADVNGDRISDLAWIQSTRVVYWASCGRGTFDGPFFLPLSGSLSVAEISQADFADVNGDALSDLIVVRPSASPNGIHYRLNLGHTGFDTRRTIFGLPAVQAGDAVRWADMNGNGSVDLLISNSARPAGTREQFLDIVPGIRPGLLRRIDNGMGLVTTLDFESSVDQMVHARAQNQPWTSTMPISIPVVARITEDDSRGNQYVREMTYRDPFFEPIKQEFRGFAQTDALDLGDATIPTLVASYSFDTGEDSACRKGKILSVEIRDAGGARFERTENAVQKRVLEIAPNGREICFPFDEAVDRHVYEQTADPVHIRTEYQFDDFGNVLQENKHGIADQDGDEVFVEKAYVYNPATWLMDRLSRSTTRDGKGAQAAEDLFTYDERGNLVEQRRWLDLGDRYVVSVRNEYDSFGNIIHIADANNHSRTLAYDPMMHIYPISETVHLESMDLVATATYDIGFGTVATAVDFAGSMTAFEYDPLGRQVAIIRPGGAETRYSYELGSPLSRITTKAKESTGGGTFDSYAYVDGYGRALGTKLEGENGQWRFIDAVSYNKRKLENIHWLPYYTATPEYENPDLQMPFHNMTYDAQGRNTETIQPDGTTARVVFEPLLQHVFDENDTAGANSPTTQRKDGLNRLVEIIERNGADEYHSRYRWNTLGRLLEVADAQGNKKSMNYDSLQRNVFLNDPDRGTVLYEYDDVGNTLRTTDAKGQATVYAYDFANRMISENYLDQGGGLADPVDVRYIYDLSSANVGFGDGTTGTPTFTVGRLSRVIDQSGEEHRSYDARGNVLWSVKRIHDPSLGVLTSYKTRFTYDLMDRITEVYYPDLDRCRYTYNSASLLETIDSGPGGRVILGAAAYEPSGQLANITFGNGVTSTYAYDNRNRLSNLRTISPLAGELVNHSYTFDNVSNIIRIDDNRPIGLVPGNSPRRNTQVFQYDDLYRLTQVKYPPTSDGVPTLGQIAYTYDKIGNILHQSTPAPNQPGHISDPRVNIGPMSSGGSAGTNNRTGRLPGDPPGPHALTATGAGGTYEYDDNGNMTSLAGANLTWDFKNRLTRFQKEGIDARYTYDFADRRITKFVSQGGHADQTLYINQYFEYRPDRAPVKYVFNGSTRVAQVSGTLDPAQPRLQRIWLAAGWNLLTIAVNSTQSAGELFGPGTVYEWTGAEYRLVASNAAVPHGRPLWVYYVAGPLVAVARGSYEPPVDHIVIAPGQHLIAWPKLEPFVLESHSFPNSGRIHAFDAIQDRWLLADSALPPFVTDALESLPAGSAFWFDASEEVVVVPDGMEAREVSYYHGDHMGSPTVITDTQGAILKETAHYPFGFERHTHQPAAGLREPYAFAQKERDSESDLHYFEARYLAGTLARLITADPKFSNPAALSMDDISTYLSQPQKFNLYAYAGNNPVSRIDPTGLDDKLLFAGWIRERNVAQYVTVKRMDTPWISEHYQVTVLYEEKWPRAKLSVPTCVPHDKAVVKDIYVPANEKEREALARFQSGLNTRQTGMSSITKGERDRSIAFTREKEAAQKYFDTIAGSKTSSLGAIFAGAAHDWFGASYEQATAIGQFVGNVESVAGERLETPGKYDVDLSSTNSAYHVEPQK